MTKVKLRIPYQYDVKAASREAALICDDPSRAKQEFKEESDINTIVRRFNLTGQLPSDVKVPMEADFEEIYDLHGAMNIVRASQESFMMMPADVRARFRNDPVEFLEFVHDGKNVDEAIALGIAVKRPQAVPPASPGASPAASPSGDLKQPPAASGPTPS